MVASEAAGEIGGVGEAGLIGHLRHRELAGEQQLRCLGEPAGGDIIMRRFAGECI